MNNSLNQQKQLAHFINFHSHPHAQNYNTIDTIISSSDTLDVIRNIMCLLKKDYLFLRYHSDTDTAFFLTKFADALKEGTTIFLFMRDRKIDAIIYDQLIRIREKNTFSVNLSDADAIIHPNAKIFIVLNSNREYSLTNIVVLSDHVLELGGRR